MPGLRSAAEGMFVPLFFASAGLYLDLSFTTLPIATIVALVVFPSLGKFAGAFIGTYIARLDNPLAQSTGLMAKGVAEIALLLVLFENGVIGQDVFSLFVLMMFGYIMLMPQAINFTVDKAKKSHRPKLPDAVPFSFARQALQDITVNHVMDRTRTYANSALSAKDFVDDWTVHKQQDYLVVDDGIVAGVVSLPRLQAMSINLRTNTLLRNVLRSDIPQAQPDELIEDVLKRMTDHSLSVIPVTERGLRRVSRLGHERKCPGTDRAYGRNRRGIGTERRKYNEVAQTQWRHVMKIGVTQIILGKLTLDETLALCRDAGYEALELVFSPEGDPNVDMSDDEVRGVKKRCDDAGIEISSAIARYDNRGNFLSRGRGRARSRYEELAPRH